MEVRLNKPVIMCGSDGGDIYDEELSSLQQALRLIDGELTRLDIEEGSGDYKFANALYVLSPQGRFVGLVDLLKAWRDEFLATSPVYGPMISGTGKT